MKKRNCPTPRAGASDQQFLNEHEEKELIASVENEEWTPVSDFDSLKKRLMRDATETAAKDYQFESQKACGMNNSLQGRTTYHHSYVCGKLIAALSSVPEITVFSELALQIEDKDYIPDICLYPKREVNLTGKDILRMTEMPLAVIEILSPTQIVQEILEKFDRFLQAGIRSCWLVVPFAQTVSVYQSIDQAAVFHNEKIYDSALQIELEWRAVFA